jgi:two-component system cell cycle sensor histidine kinase/response regulator CckA
LALLSSSQSSHPNAAAAPDAETAGPGTELERRIAEMRAIIESIADAVYIGTAEGITMANEPALTMLGYDDLAALNRDIATLGEEIQTRDPLTGRRLRPDEEAFARALGGEMVTYEVLVRHLGTGEDRLLRCAAAPVRVDGRIIGAVAVNSDITDQRRAELRLRQVQRMESVGRLAGGMAHEVNNQMTVVLGSADFALRHPGLPAAVRDDLQQIRRAAERSAHVTAQLLAYSRRQLIQAELLDLNELITGFAPVLRRVLGQRNRLILDLSPELGRVRADRSQLEQVLLNLVLNARDAMPEGGTLTLETAHVELAADHAAHKPDISVQPGRYVLLAVSDTGTGMDPETLQQVFEPFFTTKPVGQGTGLGLSSVYGIVKQSAGYIWAYSEPGRGSVFRVYLPQADAAGTQVDASGTATDAAPEDGRQAGRETVLIVEDEPMVLALAARTLIEAGYAVLAASSRAEALEVTATHAGPIHLALVDVVLPGATGREVAAALVQDRPNLALLFMSGFTGDDVARRGLADTAGNFLQKPFAPGMLLERVREVLGAESPRE